MPYVFDVRQNIEGDARHLRGLVNLHRSNVPMALAAYNAGAEAVANEPALVVLHLDRA